MIGGVYLAYPIDQRGPASLVYLFEQVDKVKAMLIDAGIASWVFDPGDAFRVNPHVAPIDTLDRVNRAALANSDVVVAFLPAGVPTVGVPMEIDRAFSMGKHVVIFADVKSWSLTAFGNRSRIARYSDWEDDTLAEAMNWVGRNADTAPDPFRHPTSEMRVRLDHPDAQLPKRAYDDDAGLDLYVAEDVVVPRGEFRDVACGLSLELPEHTWGLVTGRSSALRTHGLLVHSGIIDTGYRGPIFAGVYAMQKDVHLKVGDRVAQLILFRNATENTAVIPVDALSASARGERGFGSSGA